MKCLLIGGYKLAIGGGSKFWTMKGPLEAAGHMVQLRECLQNSSGVVTPADVAWADVIIVDSWACASLWHIWHTLEISPILLLIILVGVPDDKLYQFYIDLWHAPKFVAHARCFDVNDIPISCTLQNTGFVDVSFGQPIPDARYVNIHCDNLFPPVMFPGQKHVGIAEKQEVLDAIVAQVSALAAGGAVEPREGILPAAQPIFGGEE